MGDRVRLGEVLVAAGSIVLAVLLVIGAWFEVAEATVKNTRGNAAAFVAAGTTGATELGWFALLLAGAGAASALWYIVRVLTAKTTERPMLQAPIAYAWGALAFIALFVRLVIAVPDYEFELAGETLAVPMTVTSGGWIGLAAGWMIVVGLWIAMSDDRVAAKGPKARTAALLASITTRPAPPATGGAPSPDASVVADDALPVEDAPFNPSIRPSGGTA